ncbi:MAG: shikimate kinase [Deltaproteobacteria bacterium]|nr:shikimate kinase [Deltaproteobacteria bacterium]
MNVVMVGFMGSGKTAIGRRLAQRLGYRFLDTDHYIESELGRTINDIFAQEGEAYFRQLETALAVRLSRLTNHVISTGGGMVATPGNMELLRQAGTVVFLNADVEEILQRLERDTKRPMLKGHDLRERTTRLLEERMPFYLQSHWVIPTHGKSVNRVAGEIIRKITGGDSE